MFKFLSFFRKTNDEALVENEYNFREMPASVNIQEHVDAHKPLLMEHTLGGQQKDAVQITPAAIAPQTKADQKRITAIQVELSNLSDDPQERAHAGPSDTQGTAVNREGPVHDPEREREIADASAYYLGAAEKLAGRIAKLEAQFPDPDQRPQGAQHAIEQMRKNMEHDNQMALQVGETAGERYDRLKRRRQSFGVEPRRFGEFEGKLTEWQREEEMRLADDAIRNLFARGATDTWFSFDEGSNFEIQKENVNEAIRLKRSSQLYIMENDGTHPLYGWDAPQAVLDDQVIRAILPNLDRETARKLYEQQTSLTKVVDAFMASEVKRDNLWPDDKLCRVLDTMGINTAEDLIRKGKSDPQILNNQYAHRLAGLLDMGNVDSQKELNIRLDYYRRRMETSRGEDPDLSIAVGMVKEIGIPPELATEIVLSAEGNKYGQGLSVIGLEPAMAIVSMAHKVERFGVDAISKLHNELGTTSFHWYDDEHVEFLLKVIDKDPKTLQALQEDDTLVSFVDATDDYNGAMSSIIKASHPQQTNGRSLVFEVGRMGGSYTVDTLLQKYATFLSERGISIKTAIIGGHGYPDSGGVLLGGLLIGLGKDQESIDSPGMRAIMDLMHDEGTIIVESCCQGAMQPDEGISTTGEFARIANLNKDSKGIYAYGHLVPSNFTLSHELGGVVTTGMAETVFAYVDDDGKVHQELVPDNKEDSPYVIPIPALQKRNTT